MIRLCSLSKCGRYRYSLERRLPDVVGPTLCRLSVGIEDVQDIWADLDGALRAVLG